MTVKDNKVIRTWGLISAVIILVFFLGIFISNLIIRNRIRQITEISPAIKISYSSLHSNLFTGTVFFQDLDIHFMPYPGMPEKKHSMLIPRAYLKGIDIFKFIFNKKLSVNQVLFAKVNLLLDSFLIAKKDSAQAQIFKQAKLPYKASVIKLFKLNEINTHFYNDTSGPSLVMGDISIHGLQIGDPVSNGGKDFIIAGMACKLNNLEFTLPDSTSYVQIEKFALNSEKAVMEIDSLRISPRKKVAGQNRVDVIIPSIKVTGMKVKKLLQNKFIAEELFIEKGQASIYRAAGSPGSRVNKLPFAFQVKKIRAGNLSLFYEDPVGTLAMLADINMNEAMMDSSRSNFNYGTLLCDIAGFRFFEKRRHHYLTISKIKFNSREELIKANDLKLVPQYGKYEFARKLGRQTDWVEAAISEINIYKPDIPALVRHQFIAQKLVVGESNFRVFRDRRIPRLQVYTPLLMAHLRKLPFDIRLKACEFKNTRVEYEEYPERGYSKTGVLRIEKITGSVSPFVNHPLPTDPNYVILNARGALMGSGAISMVIKMPVHNGKPYHIEGVLKKMDLTKLSSCTENLGKIRIKSGYLNHLYFNFYMNEKQSTGKIVNAYHNLVLQQLKKKSNEKEVAFFASLLLRRVIIPKDRDESVQQSKRTGNVTYARDTTRYIPHYFLQTLLTGIKASFTFGFLLPK